MNKKLSEERQPEEFLRQLNFLKKRTASFDQGDWDEAIAAATHIRVIVHDSSRSRSLLTYMGVKESMTFFSSCEGINPRNLLPTEPFTIMRLGSSGAQRLPLDDELISLKSRPVNFNEWWTMPVMKDAQGNIWTREDLIVKLSNKGGGAHLEDFEEKEETLRVGDSFGWSVSIDGKAIPFDDSPWLPSAQVIAKELIIALEAYLSHIK